MESIWESVFGPESDTQCDIRCSCGARLILKRDAALSLISTLPDKFLELHKGHGVKDDNVNRSV